MKHITNIIIVLALTALGVSAQQDGQNVERVRDETAIRGNVEQMAGAWNTRNGAGFAKPFAEDSDYIVVNGLHVKGRAANSAGHQRIFDTIYKDSHLKLLVEKIRFLRPDVALVHVHAALRIRQSDPGAVNEGRITMVMAKGRDKWEIAAFQNTPIQNAETKAGK